MKGSRDFNPSNSGEVKGHIITEPTPARNRIGCEEALMNFHQWKYPKHAGGLQLRTEAANWCILSSSIPVQQTTLFLKQKYEQLEEHLVAEYFWQTKPRVSLQGGARRYKSRHGEAHLELATNEI
ncbi:hypothetical protein D5086_012409 [Populus alba]|uniref:Uncharacterized protein n=1 Tax=Populus alba TaxID=43335 RepID=A0ACC4C3W3_POPAL